MKKLKKIALRILVLVCIVILAIVTYFEIGGYFLLGDSRETIGEEIKEAPALPENFLKVYKAVYPDALNSGLWSYIASEVLIRNYKECPCRNAALQYTSSDRGGTFINIALMTFQIEDRATQRECLEFVLEHMDFSNGIRGVENAAKYYYNKNLNEVNEDEALELIVIAISPGLYNKQRRPGLVKQKVEELKEAIKNKT